MGHYYDEYTGGYHELESEADVEEFHEYMKYQKARSVEKKCEGCGRMVKLPVDYAFCGACADIIEQGGDPHYVE